jgi:hypothetical protein
VLLRYDTDRDRDGDVQGYAEKGSRRKRKANGRREGQKRVEMVILGW